TLARGSVVRNSQPRNWAEFMTSCGNRRTLPPGLPTCSETSPHAPENGPHPFLCIRRPHRYDEVWQMTHAQAVANPSQKLPVHGNTSSPNGSPAKLNNRI